MFKQKNGITLVALVISVVVLLILAGVAINLSLGENGIIGKAKSAVGKYKQAEENEQIELAKIEEVIDNNSRETKTLTTEEYTEIMSRLNALGSNDLGWNTLSTGTKYIKKNGYVTVKANMLSSVSIPQNCTTANNVSLGTLPENYRPDEIIYFCITYGAHNANAGACCIGTDGTMKLIGLNSGTFVTGSVTFPVNN